MQMHHQLQVILKPDPGDPQERYLQSLEAIGMTPASMIFAVEDNWKARHSGPEAGLGGMARRPELRNLPTSSRPVVGPGAIVGQRLRMGWTVSPWRCGSLKCLEHGIRRRHSLWRLLLASEIEHCQYYFEVADVGP
jgi:glycyl-tRNA synthetase